MSLDRSSSFTAFWNLSGASPKPLMAAGRVKEVAPFSWCVRDSSRRIVFFGDMVVVGFRVLLAVIGAS
jgi:hypothetical protein